ncbi:MAG: tetratricopeptide repeat protein, partial [Flavobacteriales bacterium]
MKRTSVILFSLFLGVSCAPKKQIVAPSAPTEIEMNHKKFMSLFIKATNEAQIENDDKAIEIYEQCKKLNPKESAVYFELSRLYAKQRNAQMAYENANKANELSPKNKWYLLQKAQVLNRTGQQEKAIDAFEELISIESNNLGALYELAELYQRSEKPLEAVKTIERIEVITGKNPQMSYQKYLLLLEGGKENEALKEIEELLQLEPENGMGNLAMAQHFTKIGEEQKVYKKLVFVFEDPQIRTDTKLSILEDYIKKMKTSSEAEKEAESLVMIMLKTHPSDVKSYAAAGDLYSNLNDLNKANTYYEKALVYATQSYPIYMQLMDNSFNLKDFDQVTTYATQALESYPTQPVLYLYKGMGHKELKQNELAVKAFKSGQGIVVDNEKLEYEFWSKLGETYHELKEFKLSDESFDKAMKINGLDAYLLNNYSYYLSLRKVKLEKAAEMAKTANDLFPNNASFNDTYGWILYQQGNFVEAEKWIKKSLSNGGQTSGTVLEHYGDVLYKLN